MYYKLYSDAAKYPDSNKIGIGVLLVTQSKQIQTKFETTAKDNHEGEFKACIKALEFLKSSNSESDLKKSVLNYYTDSKILAESLDKQYAKHYQKYVDQILSLESEFSLVFNNWIPDRKNHGAHTLAIQALHKTN
ncbi:ribonuclease HI family protein [Fructilactobacillus sp. Tb1]|uniref:ribonuclease HI family protein n=1 Tax=Fructilactobacillus sp. Tb1 TaxID=3422304 RepID=UPI003D289274